MSYYWSTHGKTCWKHTGWTLLRGRRKGRIDTPGHVQRPQRFRYCSDDSRGAIRCYFIPVGADYGNLPIITENAEKIRVYCPDAIVITETNPVDPLNYATYLVNRHAAGTNYWLYHERYHQVQNMAAEAIGVGASNVQGFVIGNMGTVRWCFSVHSESKENPLI